MSTEKRERNRAIALFLGLLAAAGVQIEQLALVFGALGIGFGLQDVVKNFVSGLILRFEKDRKFNPPRRQRIRLSRVDATGRTRSGVVQSAHRGDMLIALRLIGR